MTRARIRRRPERPVAAWVAGLLLLAAVVAAGWAAGAVLAGHDVPLLETVGSYTWNAPEVLALGGALVLAGALMVAAALWPGRPLVTEIRAGGSEEDRAGVAEKVRCYVTTRGLARVAHGESERTDGITHARCTSTGRAVTVQARSIAATPAESRRELQARLERQVKSLAPRRRQRVRVRVRRGGEP